MSNISRINIVFVGETTRFATGNDGKGRRGEPPRFLPFLIGASMLALSACVPESSSTVDEQASLNDRTLAFDRTGQSLENAPNTIERLRDVVDPSERFAPKQDEECCSDPGSIAECWWQDARIDGAACGGPSDCESNVCDQTVKVNGATPPNGWGLCTCDSDDDCVGQDENGDPSQGICDTVSGLCGPSYCNGIKVCSCWGGCADGNTGEDGSGNTYPDYKSMCEDTDQGNPGACCEGLYPVGVAGNKLGYCCGGGGGGGDAGPTGTDTDTGTLPGNPCTNDTVAIDCGVPSGEYSPQCAQFLCDTGTDTSGAATGFCQLDYTNVNAVCTANVLNVGGYEGTAARSGSDPLSCFDGRCNSTGRCIAEPVPNASNLPCPNEAGTCDATSCPDCTQDLCVDGFCDHTTPKAITTTCNLDDDACTVDKCNLSGGCENQSDYSCAEIDDDSANPLDSSNINHCKEDVCVDMDADHLVPACSDVALDGVDATTNTVYPFTDTSFCMNLGCVGGVEDPDDDPSACSNPDDRCNAVSCNDTTDSCDVTFSPWLLLDCDDGDLCEESVCQDSGLGYATCTDMGPEPCDDYSSNECVAATCTAGVGCEYSPKAQGTPCDDGLYCSATSECNNAATVAAAACEPTSDTCTGPPIDDCHSVDCDEAGDTCVDVPEIKACDDGLACTVGDNCGDNAGTWECIPGAAKVCPAATDCNNAMECSEAEGGNCVYVNSNTDMLGADCSSLDGVACTEEVCTPPGTYNPLYDALTCEPTGVSTCCQTDYDCLYDSSGNYDPDPNVDGTNNPPNTSCLVSDCYRPSCNSGVCECVLEPSGTTCTDNDTTNPPSCYSNECNGTPVCVSTALALTDVNNLCSDLFDTSREAVDQTHTAFLGSLGISAPTGEESMLGIAGSTTCAANNYRAAATLGCEEDGTSNDLGGTGKDLAYSFRYQTNFPDDTERYAYIVKVESNFNAAVYIQDDIANAAECPEGDNPDDDAEDCVTATVSSSAMGSISWERWDGIGGNDTANIPLTQTPSATGTFANFQIPTNAAENFGYRLRGYLIPTDNGNHRFWIEGDDYVDLYLSSNADPANKVRIAYHTGYTSPGDYTKYATQASSTISLNAGQVYYIEALHKEGTQGDNMSVAWTRPSNGTRTVIAGSFLATWDGGAGGPSGASGSTGIVEKRMDWTGTNDQYGTSWTIGQYSPTNAGAHRLLIFGASVEHTNGAYTFNSVTYGNQNPATGSALVSVDPQNFLRTVLYVWTENEIKNATDGVIRLNTTGDPNGGRAMWAVMYENVSETSPYTLGPAISVTTSPSSFTLDAGATQHGAVAAMLAHGNDGDFNWTNLTEAWEIDGNSMFAAAADAYDIASAGTYSCSGQFSGSQTRVGGWSIAIHPEPAPTGSSNTTCGDAVPWECTLPYTGASTVIEEICASGNAAYNQNCCDPCASGGEDASTCGYKWCTRGYRTSDNNDCDLCGSDCQAYWMYPTEPMSCDPKRPAAYASHNVDMAMTYIDPGPNTDGTWREAIIYVDGSAGAEGDFYLTVEKVPWYPSPCERANDDARVVDITHSGSSGTTYSGTLENIVNSDHAGTGTTCGGYDCAAGFAGDTGCHAPYAANEHWPAKSYFTIFRDDSDGSQLYCIRTADPSGNALDAVLTMEHAPGPQNICYEDFTAATDAADEASCTDGDCCAYNNYLTSNAEIEFTAQVNTQYKIGVSRYGGLERPCVNSAGDNCDFELVVREGACPAGCIPLADWYEGSSGGTLTLDGLTMGSTYTDPTIGTIYRTLLTGDTAGGANDFDIGAGWDGNDQVWTINYTGASAKEVFFSGCQYGGSGAFNGMMALFDCQGNLIASNDDGCGGGGMARFSYELDNSGTPYYLIVDGNEFIDNGAYNIAVYYAPECGDTFCNGSEDPCTCPADCTTGACCGNSFCDTGEDECSCPEDCGPCGTCGGPGECLADSDCSSGLFCDTSAVVYDGSGNRISGCGTCSGTFYNCNYNDGNSHMDVGVDVGHGGILAVSMNGGCINMDTTNSDTDWVNIQHKNRTIKMQNRFAESGTCHFPYTMYYATTYCIRIGTDDILDNELLTRDYVMNNCSEWGTITGKQTLTNWWSDPRVPIRRYARQVDVHFDGNDSCVMNFQLWYDTEWGTLDPGTITCPTSYGSGVSCAPNPPRCPSGCTS